VAVQRAIRQCGAPFVPNAGDLPVVKAFQVGMPLCAFPGRQMASRITMDDVSTARPHHDF